MTPEIKTQELEVFFLGNPRENTVFCQENRHARKERAQASEFPGSPLEKLRLPYRGRMLLIAKKPFRGKPRKGFLGRDEFFQRIFLHKSQDWVIVGG